MDVRPRLPGYYAYQHYQTQSLLRQKNNSAPLRPRRSIKSTITKLEIPIIINTLQYLPNKSCTRDQKVPAHSCYR